MSNGILHDTLDKEWVNLILEAIQIGLTVDEIRTFLQTNQMNIVK